MLVTQWGKSARVFSNKKLIALVVAGISLTACAGLTDGTVRDGCIEEKITKNSYSEEFARTVCEGEYLIFGNERPSVEKVVDEFNETVDNLNKTVDDLQDSFQCLRKLNFNDPAGVCD
jgi:hypothetical protein